MLADGYANVNVTVGNSHECLSSVTGCSAECSENVTIVCHAGFRRHFIERDWQQSALSSSGVVAYESWGREDRKL